MRWCWSFGLTLCAAAAPGYAVAQEADDASCRVSTAQGNPLANRRGTIASMERLPESCLKTLMVECNRGAEEGLLDLGSAAVCSMGYEALLRKSFGGSFGAMLAWWQRDRDARRLP
jgi:hypothetical protein